MNTNDDLKKEKREMMKEKKKNEKSSDQWKELNLYFLSRIANGIQIRSPRKKVITESISFRSLTH